MKISPNERRNLLLLGAGIFLVLVWGIGIRPWLEGPVAGAERRALRLEVGEARRLLARAESIMARYRALVAAVAAAEDRYPPEMDASRAAVGVFRLLEEISTSTGLTFRSRGLRDPLPNEDPPRLRVELEAVGSPQAVIGFLDRLRFSPRRFGIERLEIVPAEGRRLRLYVLLVTLLPRAKGGKQ